MSTSYPAGGWLPPGAHLEFRQDDQGKDFATNWQGAVQAPGDGQCIAILSDRPFPSGFGPAYPVVRIDSGQFAGHEFYIGHTTAAVSAGAHFKFGDVLSHADQGRDWSGTTGGWVELGEAFGRAPGPKRASHWFDPLLEKPLVVGSTPPKGTSMPLIGYDTVNADFVVPGDAQWGVCYMDGNYVNVAAARRRFPVLAASGRIIALTVLGNTAEGEDIEPGNVGPGSAVGFVQRMHSLGTPRPVLYADQADMRTVVGNLQAAGIAVGNAGPPRPWRMFTAHPTGVQHICGPATCGFEWQADATQFFWSSIQGAWHGFHGDLDVSLARDDFFASFTPTPRDDMAITAVQNADGRLEVFVEGSDGQVWHTWQTIAGKGWKGQWFALGAPIKKP